MGKATLIVPEEEINTISSMQHSQINATIAGMLSLLDENSRKSTFIENQLWFQRMAYTITGRNGATIYEIRKNHDKLNAYVIQTISELYERDKISSQIMVSLGLQINELYNSHLELKSLLFDFASKLNAKIDSVDNYHMLLRRIEAGLCGNTIDFSQLFSVLSQLDKRTVEDHTKILVVCRTMIKHGLLDDSSKIDAMQFIHQMMNTETENAGILHLDLRLYRSKHILAELGINALESCALETEIQKKYLNKELIAQKIIDASNINTSESFLVTEVFDEFVKIRKQVIGTYQQRDYSPKQVISHSLEKIEGFAGEYEFLSNFSRCNVPYEGLTYTNAEAAFQSAKCANVKERFQFQFLQPAEAKKLGRKVKLRPDWDNIRVDIMREIIRQKFSNNPELAALLEKTGSAELVEDNTWHDNFWGNCECERCKTEHGKNMLGRLLMEYRENNQG